MVALSWDTDLTWGRNWIDSAGYFTDTVYVNNVLNFYPGAAVQNKGSNRLYNVVFDYPDFRRMYLRRLRTLTDKVLQPPGTPAATGLIETRIRQLMDAMDPPAVGTSDADLDYSKWGSWGNSYTMRADAQRIIDSYVPGRRAWLNSAQAILNGESLPPSQPMNVSLAFFGLDFSPVSRNQAEEFICLTNANPYGLISPAGTWRVPSILASGPGRFSPPTHSFTSQQILARSAIARLLLEAE